MINYVVTPPHSVICKITKGDLCIDMERFPKAV